MTPEQAVRAAVTDALENEYDEDVIMGWAEDEVYLWYNPDAETGGEG